MRISTQILLAIDTSTRVIGLALYDGAQVLGECSWSSGNRHTVELAPAVEELLRRTHLDITALSALGVALGPGSFTGLRIGLALAKGIALIHHIPLIGVPSLDILTAAQPVLDIPLVAVLRAGRGRLAAGWYVAKNLDSGSSNASGSRSWQPNGAISVFTALELNQRILVPTLVCGELTDEERHLLGRKRKNVLLASPAQSLRRPAFLAELAWKRWQSGSNDDPATLAPFYLHFNDPIPA
jgi:tRNA threonylcarbamoyladenosine biosynthesis protein TsaB